MTGPADIPGLSSHPADPSDDGEIANPRVRAAVEAFAEAPSAEGSVDVLRACLQGALLLDITGSDITLTEDGTAIAPGSTVQVAYGTGPDGEPAGLAYTSQAELARAHPDGTAVQSLVQPATAVLADVQGNDHKWLYIDPAGPTCALSREEIDFALNVPRNDALREALEAADADPDRRGELVEALQDDGALVVALGGDAPDEGQTQEQTQASVLGGELPDGSPGLFVFTSGPEAIASAPQANLAVITTADVQDMLRDGGFGGVVVNPAGPWAAVPAADLLS
jgi:hypothetical protein